MNIKEALNELNKGNIIYNIRNIWSDENLLNPHLLLNLEKVFNFEYSDDDIIIKLLDDDYLNLDIDHPIISITLQSGWDNPLLTRGINGYYLIQNSHQFELASQDYIDYAFYRIVLYILYKKDYNNLFEKFKPTYLFGFNYYKETYNQILDEHKIKIIEMSKFLKQKWKLSLSLDIFEI